MYVTKRNGTREEVKLDKVTSRVKGLAKTLKIDPILVSQKVVAGIYDGISTKEIDELLAETAAVLTSEHPDYGRLAGRLAVSSLHKSTMPFYQTMKTLHAEGVIDTMFMGLVKENHYEIEKKIDYDRDFNFDYFGFKTLEKSYLLKAGGIVIERPQHCFMRVAMAVAGDESLDDAFELYDLISQGYYTHATPTLFNAGTKRQQMSSCFLLAMDSDSIKGIYSTLADCAQISKNAGGIGLHIHNVRATGSKITSSNGLSTGLVPMLRVFNETARYVDQGNKRKGAFAIYLEPWHSDVEVFLDIRKNSGKEEMRARDLFPALWMPNLFFERVKKDENWTLFCPNECPGLSDCYDDGVENNFSKLYKKYESEGKGRKTMKARDLMIKIIESQIETGTPYILNKDEINKKSNQKNIGVIKSSNLCTEITEVSDETQTAVCNLASLCLPSYLKKSNNGKLYFDHEHLGRIAKIAIKNLDRVIDKNYYPTEKTRTSNLKNRPVGMGVQGMADVFFRLGIAYDSEEASKLDVSIFETIYYYALQASMELAKEKGPYERFEGSPASKGVLQFDMWNVTPSDRYDWKELKQNIIEHGLRHSLLVALMPTASTAQIFNNIESFEAQTTNVGKRTVLSGEFMVINKYLVEALEKEGLWTPEIKNAIIMDNGSIQNIPEISQNLKDIFKTVWEISQKTIINMAAARSPYICQSQSLNLWFAKPTVGIINTALFHAWDKGLKTLNYYIRSRPSVDAQKVTTTIESKPKAIEAIACSLENPEACVACGS